MSKYNAQVGDQQVEQSSIRVAGSSASGAWEQLPLLQWTLEKKRRRALIVRVDFDSAGWTKHFLEIRYKVLRAVCAARKGPTSAPTTSPVGAVSKHEFRPRWSGYWRIPVQDITYVFRLPARVAGRVSMASPVEVHEPPLDTAGQSQYIVLTQVCFHSCAISTLAFFCPCTCAQVHVLLLFCVRDCDCVVLCVRACTHARTHACGVVGGGVVEGDAFVQVCDYNSRAPAHRSVRSPELHRRRVGDRQVHQVGQ